MNFINNPMTFIKSRPQSAFYKGEPLPDAVILIHDVILINHVQLHQLTHRQEVGDGNVATTEEVLSLEEVLI